MPDSPSRRPPILVVAREDGFADDVAKLLNDERVIRARSVVEAQSLVSDEGVEVALLGPSYAHEGGVAETSLLLDVEPNLAMVLVTDTVTTALLRAALRAGHRDVIEAPITAAKLAEALGTVERIQSRLAEPEEGAARSQLGRVITVMSPKGGAGKTVVTTNVALALTSWTGPGAVAIMDADLQFGDVCLALQLDPQNSMVEAARNLEHLDEALLRSVMMRHSSGLSVLPAPLEPSLADEISTQAIVKFLTMMKRMFDYIVVDTAPFLDEPVLSILERSDVVLLLVDMDLPSVKNAKLALDTLRLIKYPMDKIKLILNRANSKARLDIEELERSLDLPVAAAVPSDKLVPRSVNEGTPVVALNPRSRVARALLDVGAVAMDGQQRGPDRARRRWFGG